MKNNNFYQENINNDENNEFSLRPKKLDDFIGQKLIKKNLSIFIKSALKRDENLDHILFYGPPGLGKTTLSQIISYEMNAGFKTTSGPILSKSGDIAAILTNLEEGDVLFIDEIHRINKNIEEILYSAMEDFKLDIMIGEGAGAKSIRIDLPKFTLIAATTKTGLLSAPLKTRFSIPIRLNFYDDHDLSLIIKRDAKLLNIDINNDAASLIASLSRGTPRIAIRLLKRIRDFLIINENKDIIDIDLVKYSTKELGINKYGLSEIDDRYIKFIYNNYQDRAVGLETIAAALSEDKNSIEDDIETYLIQISFIEKTPRGRRLTKKAITYYSDNINN